MGTTTNATESWDEKMRNHITPISAYIELILEGKMGEISETQRTKFELIRTEVEKMTELLKIAKEETVPKNSSNNEITELELKLELLETELKRNTKQIQQLKKEKTDSANLEKELTQRDVNAISTEITKIHRTLQRKNHKILTVIAVTALITLIGTNFIPAASLFENSNELNPLKSKYVIENLRGYKVGTDKFWKIMSDQPLYVNIKNDANLSEEKLQIVKDAILSTEVFKIDDVFLNNGQKGSSMYYHGWKEALSSIDMETKNPIPKNFEIISPGNSAGEIIISLSKVKDTDGVAGMAKNLVDGDQILKSEITIFDSTSLSNNELSKILRHEFGHALGLVHASSPQDLMFPQIQTNLPFISECNMKAIAFLYDENVNSEVICFEPNQ